MITRTVEQVARRALALQFIVDRGWTEKKFRDGTDVTKVREVVENWDREEGISKWLTIREKVIMDKPFGTLTMQEMAECTWSVESLIGILWILGLVTEMPEFTRVVPDNHYKLLHYAEPDPVTLIIKDLGPRFKGSLAKTSEEIEVQTNAYLIWTWRCREKLIRKLKGRVDIPEVVPNLFGEWIKPAIEILPLDKKGDLLVNCFNLYFKELAKYQVELVKNIVERRYQCFNWLLSDEEDWDEISVDT